MITPFLGWQDYMATGQPDLAMAFANEMATRTFVRFVEKSTGLINTANMTGYECQSGRPGMHIVDWMPGEYSLSEHTS
jgi:hypothetical protein